MTVGRLAVALAWAAFGAVVVVAAWRMDRLGHLGINPWSAPGLTPGLIGALIVVLAVSLAWREARRGDRDEDVSTEGSGRRTAIAAALCVAFAAGAVGSGVPFVVAATAFVIVFIAVFCWPAWRAEGRIGRGLLQATVIAVVACVGIALLFERVFLVRLP